jgi:proteasome lid subunit RPN8/RPN11
MAVGHVGAHSTPLRLSGALRAALTGLCAEGYPHEVCGLLVGIVDARVSRVLRVARARNLATCRRDHYRLDPATFVAVDEVARDDGLEIVGFWHSHPDHPARPSLTDLEAAWEGYSYLIASVARDGVRELRAWRLAGDRFVEQSIEEERA